MALTPSTMIKLGTLAPAFSLPDTSGNIVSLDDFSDARALAVVFMCNHCPYVIHMKDALATFHRRWTEQGVALVAINSNDWSDYPADSPEKMAEDVATFSYGFPYLADESQAVAKAYKAACTPDLYLFDGDRKLVYRGQFDASRPGNNEPVDGRDLANAIAAVLDGKPVSGEQIPSIGCNIKWKAGQEPDYAA